MGSASVVITWSRQSWSASTRVLRHKCLSGSRKARKNSTTTEMRKPAIFLSVLSHSFPHKPGERTCSHDGVKLLRDVFTLMFVKRYAWKVFFSTHFKRQINASFFWFFFKVPCLFLVYRTLRLFTFWRAIFYALSISAKFTFVNGF